MSKSGSGNNGGGEKGAKVFKWSPRVERPLSNAKLTGREDPAQNLANQMLADRTRRLHATAVERNDARSEAHEYLKANRETLIAQVGRSRGAITCLRNTLFPGHVTESLLSTLVNRPATEEQLETRLSVIETWLLQNIAPDSEGLRPFLKRSRDGTAVLLEWRKK